jgi:hypothetical protein
MTPSQVYIYLVQIQFDLFSRRKKDPSFVQHTPILAHIHTTDAFEEKWEKLRGKVDANSPKFFINLDCDGDGIPDKIEGVNDTDSGASVHVYA